MSPSDSIFFIFLCVCVCVVSRPSSQFRFQIEEKIQSKIKKKIFLFSSPSPVRIWAEPRGSFACRHFICIQADQPPVNAELNAEGSIPGNETINPPISRSENPSISIAVGSRKELRDRATSLAPTKLNYRSKPPPGGAQPIRHCPWIQLKLKIIPHENMNIAVVIIIGWSWEWNQLKIIPNHENMKYVASSNRWAGVIHPPRRWQRHPPAGGQTCNYHVGFSWVESANHRLGTNRKNQWNWLKYQCDVFQWQFEWIDGIFFEIFNPNVA